MQDITDAPIKRLSVRELVGAAPAELELEVLAGDGGLDTNFVDSERIQKLGLALSGFSDYQHFGRIQMLGMSELSFLGSMSEDGRNAAIQGLRSDKVSCILVTKGLEPPDQLTAICGERSIPLVRTPIVSSRAISLITEYLQEQLAPRVIRHGVLLEMFGLGVLIVGESGIGKSECALDLIARHHRLVSDDVVRIARVGSKLIGDSPEFTYEHLEIHGLGIINIPELFGISSVCDRIPIRLCIELKKWGDVENVERIGLETRQSQVFGIDLPRFTIPVSPGRNVATLVETAVRVFLLRTAGHDAAARLIERHDSMLRSADGG